MFGIGRKADKGPPTSRNDESHPTKELLLKRRKLL
jgi:hypothetical protein